MEFNKKLVGIRIMQKRKEKNLTQDELAYKIGKSKNHLSSIERGKYLPTTETISLICSVLGSTPDYYLIGKIDNTIENETISIIKQFPQSHQIIINKLLKTYLEEIHQIWRNKFSMLIYLTIC